MISTVPAARATIAIDADPQIALNRALIELTGLPVDVLLLFASYQHAAAFEGLLPDAKSRTGARIVIGCSGVGVIGVDREIEDAPAIAALALSLPDAKLTATRITQRVIDQDPEGVNLVRVTHVSPEDVNSWLIFGDPFRLDADSLIDAMTRAYPGVPVMGGFASP